MIYFIRDTRDGRIKIGHSIDPWNRLTNLKVSAPSSLEMLAVMPGGAAEEKGLHLRFAHLRVAREWFAAAADLLEFIEACQTLHPQERRKEERDPLAAERELAAYRQRIKDPWFLVNLERDYQAHLLRKGHDLGERGKQIIAARIAQAKFEEKHIEEFEELKRRTERLEKALDERDALAAVERGDGT